MRLSPKTISLISVFSNLCLGILKAVFGFLFQSIALMADGIHSTLDVFSSFITFLGLKISEKPTDEKHPYGYLRAENVAGFIVTIFLFTTGAWIVYESVERFLGENPVVFSLSAILVIILCIIIQEIVARLKFSVGKKFQSIALIADAKHSRADVISSLGVLVGLALLKYFPFADASVALIIGLYIIFESIFIGKEITESLLDVANKEIEERIRKICLAHKIEIDSLKTRKVGNYNFAELKIKLPLKLKLDEVGKITKQLEERLFNNIPELKYVVISVEPYDVKKSTIVGFLGKKFCEEEGFEKIGPRKVGRRIVIPIKDNKLFDKFGSEFYLLVDIKEGKIQRKETMKNPYFEKDSPKGVRFVKAARADEVATPIIGPNAKQNLENFGIRIHFVNPHQPLEEILESLITKEQENKDVDQK